jgi:ATP-binding cassette subfamily B protein
MYSIRRLLPYLRKYRWHMLVVIVAALSITAVNLINPWLVRELVQIVRTDSGDSALNRIMNIAALLVAVFVGRALFRFLYSYIAHVMAYGLVGDMRAIIYSHLQQLSSRFFADRQTGEILKRVINDTADLEPLVAHYIPDMIVNVLLLIGVGVILFSINPTLALLTLLPMPLLLISNMFFGGRMRKALKDSSRRLGRLSGVVQDNLTGIKEIQLFTQEQREHERIHTESDDIIRERLYGLKMQAFLTPSIEFLTGIGLAGGRRWMAR